MLVVYEQARSHIGMSAHLRRVAPRAASSRRRVTPVALSDADVSKMPEVSVMLSGMTVGTQPPPAAPGRDTGKPIVTT